MYVIASQLLAQLTSSINLDPPRQNNNQNILTFNIHFNQQLYKICMQPNATIGKCMTSHQVYNVNPIFYPSAEQLKRKIFDVTDVPQCRQTLRGWPPSKASDAQIPETQLGNLDLPPVSELILVDITDDGFMDTEQ